MTVGPRSVISANNPKSPAHLRGHDLKEFRKDRHSCSPTSHCVANHAIKKEGSGGKFTWGGVLEEPGPVAFDLKDPNYDSDQEDFEESVAERATRDVRGTAETAAVLALEEKIIAEKESLKTDVSDAARQKELESTVHQHGPSQRHGL